MRALFLLSLFMAAVWLPLKASALTCFPTGCGSGGGHIIEDEDVALAQRSALNFTGAGITCADTGTQTECTIAAGGSGSVTTVEDGDVQVGGADIVTLDFDGTEFAITEDPDTEINITIADDSLDFSELADTLTMDGATGTTITVPDATQLTMSVTNTEGVAQAGLRISANQAVGDASGDDNLNVLDILIDVDSVTVADTVEGIVITQTAQASDGVVDTGLTITNNEDAVDTMTTAILIEGGTGGNITTGIDLSSAGVGIGIALGGNNITGTGFDLSTADLELIDDAAIDLDDMAANSVDTTKIVNDTIADADINSAAGISASKLADDEIDQEELAATITFADGDLLDFGTNISSATEGIMLPAHATTCVSATAEGQVCWEEDANLLWVGDGAAAVNVGAEVNDLEATNPPNVLDTEIYIGTGPGTGNWAAISSDATMTNAGVLTLAANSVDSAEITAGAVDEDHLAATLAFDDGDLLDFATNINSATEGILLPANATTCASATAEGQVCWEEDADVLWIGDGAAAKAMGSGDIEAVFNCASGDCASITIAATDLLDMSGSDASTGTEGLILPQHPTACAGGTAEGQVCWEADANILHIGDAATLQDFIPTSAFSGDINVTGTGATTIQANAVDSAEITAGAVDEDHLAATLTFDDGDLLDFGTFVTTATEGLMLPANATTCASATAEGQVCWEEDANILWIGDGAAAAQIGGTEINDLETNDPPNVEDTEIYIGTGPGTGNWAAISSDATMTNAGVLTLAANSVDSAEITAGAVDEDHLAATLTFDDGDLLDFGTNISSATEGILLPKHATTCASATGEGQVCWDADDDSSNALWIGDGTTARNIGAGAGDIGTVGDCLSDPCFTGANGTLLQSNTDFIIELDNDTGGTNSFQIKDEADAVVAEIFETGNMQIDGDLTVSGGDITTGGSATPTVGFNDSIEAGNEARIRVNAPTLNDPDFWIQVENGADQSFVTPFQIIVTAANDYNVQIGDCTAADPTVCTDYVNIDENGAMTFVNSADIELPNNSVDTADITDLNVTEDKLAATLTFDDGDLLDFGTNVSSATEGILLPANATTCASATAEGQVCWEEDANVLWIGDGAAASQIGGAEINDLEATDPPNVEDTEIYIGTGPGTGAWAAMSSDVLMSNTGVVTIQANAVDSAEITAGAVDEDHLAASLVFDDGDLLDFGSNVNGATEGIMLPAHATTCAGATAEAQVCWEEDAMILHIGDGAALQNFIPASGFSADIAVSATGVATIQANAVDSPEITAGAVDEDHLNATLTFDDGDLLDFGTNISSATEGILLPANATTCASATAEGQVCWEEDANVLWIGDGAAAAQIGGAEINDLEAQDPPNVEDTEIYIGTGPGTGNWAAISSDATMTNAGVLTLAANSVDSAEITAGAVDEDHLAASLTFDDGDLLDFGTFVSSATEGLMLPANATTCATATAEGQVCWEEDATILHIGDGAALQDFIPAGSFSADINVDSVGAVTIQANAVDSAEITAGAVDEDHLAATLTFDDGDLLDFGSNVTSATEGIMLPAHATTCASATAEGQVCWEEDATILHIGDGAALQDFIPASVFSSDINVDSVGAVTIQANAVGTSEVDGTLTFANIADGTSAIDADTVFTAADTIDLEIAFTHLAGDTQGLTLTATQEDNAPGTDDFEVLRIQMIGQSTQAGDTFKGIVIRNTPQAANEVIDAAIDIDNAEDAVSTMTDAIIVTSTGFDGGIVDAIDVSADNITNAINVGQNPITFNGGAGTIGVAGVTDSVTVLTDGTGTGEFEVPDGSIEGDAGTGASEITPNTINGVDIADNVLGRDDIDETLLSIQTHATDCTALTCDAASDGEMCFELDADTIYTCDGGEATWKAAGGGADTNAVREICFDAASLQPVIGDTPMDAIGAGTNPQMWTRKFSGAGTDRECVNGKFSVPSDVSTTATDVVEFKIYWLNEATVSATASWDFEELNLADDADFDVAYSDQNLFDSTASATADRVEVDTTETAVSTDRELQDYGWTTADELVLFRVCRDAGDAHDTTTTEADLIMFCIGIPRK